MITVNTTWLILVQKRALCIFSSEGNVSIELDMHVPVSVTALALLITAMYLIILGPCHNEGGEHLVREGRETRRELADWPTCFLFVGFFANQSAYKSASIDRALCALQAYTIACVLVCFSLAREHRDLLFLFIYLLIFVLGGYTASNSRMSTPERSCCSWRHLEFLRIGRDGSQKSWKVGWSVCSSWRRIELPTGRRGKVSQGMHEKLLTLRQANLHLT